MDKKMKLKSTVLTIVMFLTIIQIFGQERINREKLSFETTSEVLTEATGWAYDSIHGEWINYKNVIIDSKDYKDKYLQGRSMMSRVSQNFLKVQTKIVSLKGVKYYVLVVNKWDGRYQYPSIKENWYTFKQTIGYVFSESEYQKLLNIENVIELKTKNVVTLNFSYEKYDETKFLYLIQTELSKESSKYSTDYIFPIMKSKEGAIRFYLPVLVYFLTSDFEKGYFETDIENFSKIIIK
jgi:hypothetical protein